MVTESRPSSTGTARPRGDAGPGRSGRQLQLRPTAGRSIVARTYSSWFYVPAGVIYTVIFIVPTVMSFYFALTRWSLFEAKFTGLDNFKQFFSERRCAAACGTPWSTQ